MTGPRSARLFIFTPPALRSRRLLATVAWNEGSISIDVQEPELRELLVRLVQRDFDENVGLPPVRVRAARNSLEALAATAFFLSSAFGFVTALQTTRTEESSVAVRLTGEESRIAANVALRLAPEEDRERVQQTLDLWREVLDFQREQAARFGCAGSEIRRARWAARASRVGFRRYAIEGVSSYQPIALRAAETRTKASVVSLRQGRRTLDELVGADTRSDGVDSRDRPRRVA